MGEKDVVVVTANSGPVAPADSEYVEIGYQYETARFRSGAFGKMRKKTDQAIAPGLAVDWQNKSWSTGS